MATRVRPSPRAKTQPSPLRLGGWLLLAAPLIFVGSIVWSLLMRENIAVTSDPATIVDAVAAVAPYRLSWTVSWLLSFISILAFAGGLMVLSRRLLPTSARSLALAAVICAVGAAVMWLVVVYLNIGLIADAAHLPPVVADQQVSTVGARSNSEIADRLVVSLKTVRNHVSDIFSKLQVVDRAQAMSLARKAGLGPGEL